MNSQDEALSVTRDPLALAMFAAWVGAPVEKLPAEMKGHTCPDTMARRLRIDLQAAEYWHANIRRRGSDEWHF